MMKKKNYESIAREIHDSQRDEETHFEEGYNCALRNLATDLTDIFKADNPKFDRDRFLIACGVTE